VAEEVEARHRALARRNGLLATSRTSLVLALLAARMSADDREPAARHVASQRRLDALKSDGLHVISCRELRALQGGEKKPAAAK
jgi:hypothetical protein